MEYLLLVDKSESQYNCWKVSKANSTGATKKYFWHKHDSCLHGYVPES
jgi:hypothetical protein